MTAIAIIVLFIIAAVVILRLLGKRISGDQDGRVDQIPAVVAQLRASGKNGSFAVFRFAAAGEPLDEAHTAEMQYSIESGQLGLDWTLLATRNIADKERIAAFVRDHGHAVNERQMNGVDYLRVEDGDLVALGSLIAREVYGLASDSPVDLIVEDFVWPPK